MDEVVSEGKDAGAFGLPEPLDAVRWQDVSDYVLDLLPAAVYVCDAEGTIVRYNLRAAELWGRAPIVGDTDRKFCGAFRLYRPDGRPLPHDETPMADALARGTPARDQEIVIERPDGSRIVVLVNIVPMHDAAGRRIGAVNCFVDITERKDVETRLLLAKEAGGVATFDRNVLTGTIRVSEGYWTLFGQDRDAFPPSYENWLARVHPDDRGYVVQDVERAFRSGTYDSEYRIVRPDGAIRWLHGRGRSERAPDGRPLRLIGALVDVTDRKRAEEELRLVTDSVPALVSYIDADRCYRFVNRHYLEWFGGPVERIQGQHMRDVLGDAAYDVVRPRVERALAGEAQHFEAQLDYRGAGSRKVEIDYLPRIGPDGRVLGFYVCVSDVGERRRAEEALRARTAELETVMETVPAIVWLARGRNPDSVTSTRYGDRLMRMEPGANHVQTASAVSDGARFRMFKDGREVPMAEWPLRRASRGGTVDGEEFEIVFEDGASLPLLISAAPLKNADGSPAGCVGVGIDISERRRAEARQKLISAELDHRVRNTLTSIRSMMSLVERFAQSKEEFARAVRGRIEAMARAHGLLTETQWRGASLRKLIQDELAPYVGAAGARLELAGDDLLLRPKAAVSIALVIHELTTNAVKHGALSSRDGRVSVSWAIEAGPSGPLLRCSWVERNGPPVVPPSRRGFGSMVIKGSLAHEFGAEIELSFPPEGARFSASLPLSAIAEELDAAIAPDAPRPVQRPAPAAVLAGCRVLLVEDEILIALDIRERLESAGVSVVGPVARLDQAVDLAARGRIDAALLDVNLGGTASFPLADLLAENGVPFAFMTGYDGQAIFPERFRDAPILRKPASEALIAETLQRLLDRGGRNAGP